jgi:vacuolar-type H+-ATPase subunit C/Vma6
MPESLEFAYLYARVCGAFSKMRLGEKARGLVRQSSGSIMALWKQLFDEEPPGLPEAKLLFEAERRILGQAIASFVRLAGPFSESSELIHALISKYEISAIKSMVFRIRAGEPKPERVLYTSPAIEQALANWPRVADMFAGTPYAWLDIQGLDDIAVAENRLDQQYYLGLWTAANRIPSRKIGAMLDLIRWEIIYQNVVWALRVRRYYGMTRQDAAAMVIDVKGIDTVSLAMETFQYDIDNLASFSPWPLRKLLSTQSGPGLDVPVLEIRVQEDLFSKVRRSLHLYPFSYTPIYCYFKLLEYEMSLLMAVLESVRLGVSPDESVKYMWIPGGEPA